MPCEVVVGDRGSRVNMSHFHCLSMASLYSEPCRATKRPTVDWTFHLPSLPHFFSINCYSFSFILLSTAHSNVCRCQTITLGLLPPSPMNHLIQDPSLEVTVLRYCNKICNMHFCPLSLCRIVFPLFIATHFFSFPFSHQPLPISLSFPPPPSPPPHLPAGHS